MLKKNSVLLTHSGLTYLYVATFSVFTVGKRKPAQAQSIAHGAALCVCIYI